jgi:hypothetical protein
LIADRRAVMVWWITLGGFVIGCLVAYAMVQGGGSDQDKDS